MSDAAETAVSGPRIPVTLPIPVTSSVDHLAENVAASAFGLTDEEMARLE